MVLDLSNSSIWNNWHWRG